MDKKDIVVVVPIYLPALSEMEAVSLKQCLDILSDYSIVIIKPENLDLSNIQSQFLLPKVVSFPDRCFRGIEAYNRLMLDVTFYKTFSSYTYMLVYQLDAYVFKDELFFWASLGYDYIGAPWMPQQRKYWRFPSRSVWFVQRCFWSIFYPKNLRRMKYCWFHVGNGGFSLRKISKMIAVTEHYKTIIDKCMADSNPFFPEDVFLLLNTYDKESHLKRPSYKLAMKFAIEQIPAWSYRANGCQLPFGCHNWTHPEMLPFWSQFIKLG